ncbi:head-tail adaptor protein [Tranquillimonas rosea]|uniref:head-tail adaptor protein n=1 Tax=Tranquillimonas rosea TaxID=641238 RepID=UPI003BAD0839
MSAPDLSRRLELQARVGVPDGAGGLSESWETLGVLWAAMDRRTGRETAAPGGPVGLTRWRITVRGARVGSPARPVPGQRFREGARCFAIRAVGEADPRGRYLLCDADEEVAA